MAEREPQLEPPNLLHRDRLDPGLIRAFAFSAVAHVVVIAALLIAGTMAHRALKPATTYSVGLVDLDSGSPLLDLGPLGDAKAPRENFGAPPAALSPPPIVAPPAAVKAMETAPRPAPEPKVEAVVEPPPPPPPPPEPKVEAKPPAPPPKAEVKPPEPKPVPKVEPPKPEPKKVEAKPKPAPKPEPPKAEAKPKTPAKPEPKATAKPAPAKTAAATTETKTEAKPAASATAKPGSGDKPAAATGSSAAAGQMDIAKAVPPGPGSGGGGGFGGTGPGGGPAGGELRPPEFVAYFEHIKRTIRRGWVWQTADPNIRTTVGFAVLADGRLANIRSVEPSGDARFDLSVLNAVRAAQGQLGPPPAQFQKDFSDVQIVFRPQDLAE